MRHRDTTLSGVTLQPRPLCSPLGHLSSQTSLARNLLDVPRHTMSQDTTRGPIPRGLAKRVRPPIWQLRLPFARPKMDRGIAYALVLRRALLEGDRLGRWFHRRRLGRWFNRWRLGGRWFNRWRLGGRTPIFLPQDTSLHTGIALGPWHTVYHTPLRPTNWNHAHPSKLT